MGFIKNKKMELILEHKADINFPIVSAASILAKSVREREMGRIREIYGGGIGSGYTSDPATCKFLEKHAQKYKKDGIFRQTWSTWKRACEKSEQRRLGG